MNYFKRINDQALSRRIAKASWEPTLKEKNALNHHKYVESLGRVDQMWKYLANKYAQVIAVDAIHATHPETYTFSELSELIDHASMAFDSLGINKGDVLGFFSENSPRWLIADQGLMRLDAANAVRGASAPVEELRYILEDSEATALVVQNDALWKKLDLSISQKSRFKFVLQLEGIPSEGLLGWDEFIALGAQKSLKDIFENRHFSSSKSTIATILYTSGTTGKPKGVPLNHENLLHQITSLACVANPPAGSSVLSVLPIWHSYERSAEYYFFSCGCTQHYTSTKHLKQDLQRVKPLVMATVPRLWEAIKSGFDDAVKKMPSTRQKILTKALDNSASYKLALRTFRSILINKVTFFSRISSLVEVVYRWPVHVMASLILWPKILKQLTGGKLLFPINGGGAIAPHVDVFFESLGVELLVGYGLTETSPVVSCRRPWRNIRGSAGSPLPNTQFLIVDNETAVLKKFYEKGRVLVRGPQVMSGYLGKPEATARILDLNGWFDTGDLGMLLPDGSLVLTGRAKDTIVLSNGENIEPGPLEEFLVSSPLIQQILLVGQDQKQLGALVVPEVDYMLYWAKQKGLDLLLDWQEPPGQPQLRSFLRREINFLLAKRSGSRTDERIAGVALVDPFTIENGLLTQTLKQRRDKIADRDRRAIVSIFTSF